MWPLSPILVVVGLWIKSIVVLWPYPDWNDVPEPLKGWILVCVVISIVAVLWLIGVCIQFHEDLKEGRIKFSIKLFEDRDNELYEEWLRERDRNQEL